MELTEEEIAQKKLEEENKKIEEGFDKYSELDAGAESQKIQNSVLEKKNKKAVSWRLFELVS